MSLVLAHFTTTHKIAAYKLKKVVLQGTWILCLASYVVIQLGVTGILTGVLSCD